MKLSVLIAAHNEGNHLLKTVAAAREALVGLDAEIIIADDASTDYAVDQVLEHDPEVRAVRHPERRGASPTKHLATTMARGEIFLFLDGHTNPTPRSLAQLVEDIEIHQGRAVMVPAIAQLDTETWQNSSHQIGYGYGLDLATLRTRWLARSQMTRREQAGRIYYESPALIGCCFAIHRDLYREIGGMDVDMRQWGVEDLDLGMKAWLHGATVLVDPAVVIGHRFRKSFDNYTVDRAHILANELRFARKHFRDETWREWRTWREQRISPEVREAAWNLFEARRASVEQERLHLQATRINTEHWYADRFGLDWPADAGDNPLALMTTPTFLMASGGSPEPSGSCSSGSCWSSSGSSQASSGSGSWPHSTGSSIDSSSSGGSQESGSSGSSAQSSGTMSSAGSSSSAISSSMGSSLTSSGSTGSSTSGSSSESQSSSEPGGTSGGEESSTNPEPSSQGEPESSGQEGSEPAGSSGSSGSNSSDGWKWELSETGKIVAIAQATLTLNSLVEQGYNGDQILTAAQSVDNSLITLNDSVPQNFQVDITPQIPPAVADALQRQQNLPFDGELRSRWEEVHKYNPNPPEDPEQGITLGESGIDTNPPLSVNEATGQLYGGGIGFTGFGNGNCYGMVCLFRGATVPQGKHPRDFHAVNLNAEQELFSGGRSGYTTTGYHEVPDDEWVIVPAPNLHSFLLGNTCQIQISDTPKFQDVLILRNSSNNKINHAAVTLGASQEGKVYVIEKLNRLQAYQIGVYDQSETEIYRPEQES